MTDATDESYRACVELSKRTAGNFYYSFWALPPEKRRAQCALYAFFRRTDDLGDADTDVAARRAALGDWRRAFEAALAGGECSDPLLPAVVDTIRRYAIPPDHLRAAIDGVETDLERSRFATFDELAAYCRQVASAVGLACIHVWGFRRAAQAYEAADRCGLAFQLTNILRDVGEDAARGRLYLPQDELAAFDVAEGDVLAGRQDDDWRRLVDFQIQRAEGYYRDARRLLPYLDRDGVGIYGAMIDIYHGLLAKIRRRRGDVFSSRVRLSRWFKGAVALRHLTPRLGSVGARRSSAAPPLRSDAR